MDLEERNTLPTVVAKEAIVRPNHGKMGLVVDASVRRIRPAACNTVGTPIAIRHMRESMTGSLCCAGCLRRLQRANTNRFRGFGNSFRSTVMTTDKQIILSEVLRCWNIKQAIGELGLVTLRPIKWVLRSYRESRAAHGLIHEFPSQPKPRPDGSRYVCLTFMFMN